MAFIFNAYLLIDDNTPTEKGVFAYEPSAWSLVNDHGLACSSDKKLFFALGFNFKEIDSEPLFPLRGMCSVPLPDEVQEDVEEGDFVSWMTYSELMRSLKSRNVQFEELYPPSQLLVKTLETASSLYSDDRVRLLYYFLP